MRKDLTANPPSPERALVIAKHASKKVKFRITPAVREAITEAFKNEEHYPILCNYYNGGSITGSRIADSYALAQLLVEWEAAAGRTALSIHLAKAKDEGGIKLVDIVKRITPELGKLVQVEQGVITGEHPTRLLEAS